MKQFAVYRNIRKGAVIMGLSISLFALMMASVIGSLLVIIFSFKLWIIISLFLFNGALYAGLLNSACFSFTLRSRLPRTISNKKSNFLNNEDQF
ncbi:hypothetical protein [Galbibacter pacificus]|uniref:Uncharacterized protein n=1 Tax=Galbibacter pacificus TaxID=2996052 RepID=A0ABT6FRV0_9FLAO|nr:hypothetical protein [Galbibacter pacificus]MDG3582910.1 hypothetical protein [Galbibacter pacificus]MDG3585971.1 hypothetical protein [Galbibacter pacificus]